MKRDIVRLLGGALLAGVAVLASLPACAGPTGAASSASSDATAPAVTGASRPANPEPAAPTTPRRPEAAQDTSVANPSLAPLQLVVGRRSEPLDNGAVVAVGKDLSAEIFVWPFPPRPNSSVDLYLFRPDTQEPVRDARVTFTSEMLYMEHGFDHRGTLTAGDGHYALAVDDLMFGDWLFTIDIERPAGTTGLQLYLRVFR